MNFYRKLTNSVGASFLVLSFCGTAHAQETSLGTAVSGKQSRAPGPTIQEIVVTAQKREQRLQDVPVSITALTQESLAANRVQNVGDLNAIAPNVTVRQSTGGAGIPAFTMRGILSSGVAPGGDREVGYYLDGVYIGHAQGSMFDFADIQRIEVLRGPQGTLFGRNATAGAISVITQHPSGKFGLRQEVTLGNYDQFRSKTRVDLPAMGPFSAAVTFAHSERRGDTRNLGAGTVWDFTNGGKGMRTSPKWLGNENTDSVFAVLKFDPGNDFSVTYKFDWSDHRGTPPAHGLAGFGIPADGGLSKLLYSLQQDPTKLTPISPLRPKAVNNAFTTEQEMRTSGHNVTLQWGIADGVSIKNILAFRKASNFASHDWGYGGVTVPPGLPLPFPVGSRLLIGSFVDYGHKQWSDELQLNVDTELAAVTAGLLHYHQNQTNGGPQGLDNVFILTPVLNNTIRQSSACVDPLSPTRETCGGRGRAKGTSQAAYVQVEVHVTPTLDIVGGYRVTHDKKSGGYINNSFRYSDTNSSYMAGVNLKPVDDILLYAKYSSAFMSGGGNIGNYPAELQTYAPEFAYSWEAGIKSELLDRRLRANLALFSVKYKDMQLITSGQLCGDPASGVCVYNAADSRAKGFEFELTAAPVDRLTISAGVGYTDVKYSHVNPRALAATGSFEPHLRPKWTGNASLQYDTGPISGDAYFSMRLDASYRSKALLDSSAPAAFRSVVTTPSVWILNGRVALVDIEIAGHKADVAFWGRNLTNDEHATWTNSVVFAYPVAYERARTLGVDLKFAW